MFPISISACSFASRCSLISLTATSVGLRKHPRRRMISFDAEHRAVHYPADRRFRIWILPSILIGTGTGEVLSQESEEDDDDTFDS